MKFNSILALAVTLAAAIAVPVADNLSPEQLAELEVREAEAGLSSLDLELSTAIETRGLTRAECKIACSKGPDAVEVFCRRLPVKDLRVRAACWAAATAIQSPLGQRACLAFCDAWF